MLFNNKPYLTGNKKTNLTGKVKTNFTTNQSTRPSPSISSAIGLAIVGVSVIK